MRKIALSIITLTAAVVWPSFVFAATNVSVGQPAKPVALSAPELTVTVTADQTKVTPPADVLITLIVTNTGSEIATAVSIDHALPVEFNLLNPEVVAAFKNLGDLAPGDTITKSIKVNIPASVKTGRYVDEAIASATNADSVQSFLTLEVSNGQVLGASDQLAETGYSLWLFLILGGIFTSAGVFGLAAARQ